MLYRRDATGSERRRGGLANHVGKPVDPAELFAVIAAVTRSR
jgi:hypothetical protein